MRVNFSKCKQRAFTRYLISSHPFFDVTNVGVALDRPEHQATTPPTTSTPKLAARKQPLFSSQRSAAAPTRHDTAVVSGRRLALRHAAGWTVPARPSRLIKW